MGWCCGSLRPWLISSSKLGFYSLKPSFLLGAEKAFKAQTGFQKRETRLGLFSPFT